jgi:hypothetical protein
MCHSRAGGNDTIFSSAYLFVFSAIVAVLELLQAHPVWYVALQRSQDAVIMANQGKVIRRF